MESGEVRRTGWSTSLLKQLFSCLLRSPAVLKTDLHSLQLLVVDGKEVVAAVWRAVLGVDALGLVVEHVIVGLFVVAVAVVWLIVVGFVVVMLVVVGIFVVWLIFAGLPVLGVVVVGIDIIRFAVV